MAELNSAIENSWREFRMLLCDFFENRPNSAAVLNICSGLLLSISIFFTAVQVSNAACLPYYLYGYNKKFVHFPKDTTYCVQTDDGKIRIATDELGGRIIKKNNSNSPILRLFGESQLFGFDVSGKPGSHDLNYIYPEKDLIFYGAPNNGPFESIEYIKYILEHVKLHRMILGFNFGTDVFRSMPEWNPERFVLLDSKDLEFYQNFPFLYEVKITMALFGGGFFTTNRPNKIKLRHLYSELDKNILNERIKIIFNNIEDLSKDNNIKVNLIVYPPYWGYEKDENGAFKSIKLVMDSFKKFVCNDLKRFIFLKKILVGKLVGSAEKIYTADKRHFAQGQLEYISDKMYCAIDKP